MLAFLDPLFRHPRLTVSQESKQPLRALLNWPFSSRFCPTYTDTSGTGGALPIVANVTIDNIIATATKQQGAIIGMSNSLMGVPSSGDTGISMTNTKISGG
ncbi:MAG: hypothetical protein VB138_11855 [Burkholderia sp.]